MAALSFPSERSTQRPATWDDDRTALAVSDGDGDARGAWVISRLLVPEPRVPVTEEEINTLPSPWLTIALELFDEDIVDYTAALADALRHKPDSDEPDSTALATQPTPLPARSDEQTAVVPIFEPDGHPLTDYGNAERLVDHSGHELRYCATHKAWYYFDGRLWLRDVGNGAVMRCAKTTVRDLRTAAGRMLRQAHAACDNAEEDPAVQAALRFVEWIEASESKGRLGAMIDLAQSDPAVQVRPDDLDRNPWLLNVTNGTLDLRTGELRPHDPADLITKLAPVAYDPTATCPRFQQFVHQIMLGRSDLVRFIQQAFGMALTGDTSERVFFVLHGEGRNGKSALLAAMRGILGEDYSANTPTETLLAKRSSGIPNDIARLAGIRLVTASETEEGHRLAVSRIKQMAGGADKLSARFLYAEFFDFQPEFKLLLASNHRPTVTDTTDSIWDRLRLIPFDFRVPDGEQNPRLTEELLADEAAGILAWAVQGCLAWQTTGMLVAPHEVLAATQEYRESQDTFGQFLAERCVVRAGAVAAATNLLAAYNDWAVETHERPLNAKALANKLGERGLKGEAYGPTRRKHYKGVGLLPTGAAPGERG